MRLSNAVCAMAVALSACFAHAAPQGVMVTEIASSDVRVSITQAMEGLGFDLQEAHDFAVLAADGVNLQDQEAVCFTYLVTLWWCEQEGDTEAMKTTKFRMDESCFDSFFPAGTGCLDSQCPPGSRRYYALESGTGFCFGIPPMACVHMEICGPVESTCSSLPACACLKLQEKSCEQTMKCVPVTGAPSMVVPDECPACN